MPSNAVVVRCCAGLSASDVVVAPALVPCLSASALACCHCCCRHMSLAHQRPCLPSLSGRLLSLARQRPPSPAVVVAAAAAAADVSRCTRHIVAVCRRPRHPTAPLAIPSTSVCPAPPQSLLPPSPLCRPCCRQISCFLGKVPFHVQRNHLTRSKKHKSS